VNGLRFVMLDLHQTPRGYCPAKGVIVTANSPGNPDPSCSFCDGSGVWTDPDDGPASTPDPCPLCIDGRPQHGAIATRSDTTEASVDDVLSALPGLTQPERQQVYEELYSRWDCRIYQS
jgi:hypothetical protein